MVTGEALALKIEMMNLSFHSVGFVPNWLIISIMVNRKPKYILQFTALIWYHVSAIASNQYWQKHNCHFWPFKVQPTDDRYTPTKRTCNVSFRFHRAAIKNILNVNEHSAHDQCHYMRSITLPAKFLKTNSINIRMSTTEDYLLYHYDLRSYELLNVFHPSNIDKNSCNNLGTNMNSLASSILVITVYFPFFFPEEHIRWEQCHYRTSVQWPSVTFTCV